MLAVTYLRVELMRVCTYTPHYVQEVAAFAARPSTVTKTGPSIGRVASVDPTVVCVGLAR